MTFWRDLGRWGRSAVGISLITAAFFGPLGAVVWASVSTPTALQQYRLSPPSEFTLQNYRELLSPSGGGESLLDAPLTDAVGWSFAIAGISTLVALFIGLPAGIGLARLKPKLRWTLIGLFASARMLPSVAFVVPFRELLNEVGLVDHFSGLVLGHFTLTLPIVVIVIAVSVPRSLLVGDRQAALDGLPWITRLRVVSIPSLLVPAIVGCSIGFLMSWNDFSLSFFLTSRRITTAPMVLAGLETIRETLWGQAAAAVVILSLPVVALALGFLGFRELRRIEVRSP